MSDQVVSSKRLAKNTMVLYLRMFLTVGISFYISRVVLASLGVSDYGLYNVVGGFVSMFYIITSTLSNSISRFLTVELGRDDREKLINVFSASMIIMIGAVGLVLLLGETIGLWFVNSGLNFDSSRMGAANWLYQFSLVSFMFEMICVPFNALVIAHERMKAFAFFAIAEVLLKLGFALILDFSPVDKLVFYGFLMMVVSVTRQGLYLVYSIKQFDECKLRWHVGRELFVEIFKFTGWKFVSITALMVATSGVNIILNLFHGTVLNAANGVATQVKNAAGAFCKNFTIALNPQITKSYASGDEKTTVKLVYRGCKLSFILCFCIMFPIMLETEYLLGLWLKEVPPYAPIFVQLTLVSQMIDVVFFPLWTLNSATGDIKKFELTYSLIILNLPLSYLFLKWGCAPYSIHIVYAAILAFVFIPCFVINKKHIKISIRDFFKEVVLRLLAIVSLSFLVSYPLTLFFEPSFVRMCMVVGLAIISSVAASFLFGLTRSERAFVFKLVKSKINIL